MLKNPYRLDRKSRNIDHVSLQGRGEHNGAEQSQCTRGRGRHMSERAFLPVVDMTIFMAEMCHSRTDRDDMDIFRHGLIPSLHGTDRGNGLGIPVWGPVGGSALARAPRRAMFAMVVLYPRKCAVFFISFEKQAAGHVVISFSKLFGGYSASNYKVRELSG